MDPSPVPIVTATPVKKKTSGCLIAFLVVGGLGLLLCLGGSIAIGLAARSETGQKILDAVGKGMNMVEKGMKAPGTPELRAAGCPQPLVINTRDALDLAAVFSAGDDGGEELDELMVFCQVPRFRSGKSLPKCDVLARVYARATAPTEPFLVLVQWQGASNKPICLNRYAPDGTPLESMILGE